MEEFNVRQLQPPSCDLEDQVKLRQPWQSLQAGQIEARVLCKKSLVCDVLPVSSFNVLAL